MTMNSEHTRMESLRSYLTARVTAPVLALIFLGVAVYRQAQATGAFLAVACIAIAALALALVRPPRWVSYAFLLGAMVVVLGHLVFVSANGPQDRLSDRDDAAEIAARALSEGRNPWGERSILGLPVTTSPTGILAAVPFVHLTGRIDALSFLFWVGMLALLLAGDLSGRNNTFMVLGSLLLLPETGMTHAAYWGLDELYWPIIVLPPIVWAMRERRFMLAGAMTAIVLMGRLSYGLPVVALVGWLARTERRPWMPVTQFVAGGVAGVALLLVPFAAVGGSSLLHRNFVTVALGTAQASTAQPVGLLGLLSCGHPRVDAVAPFAVAVVVLGAALWFTAQRTSHPYWHVALAALLTQCLLFVPGAPSDYIFTVLGPAFLAVAFTPGVATTAEGAVMP